MYNSILDLLVSQGDVDKVDEIFEEMILEETLRPDEITFNTIIKGSCKNKDLNHSMNYFKRMKRF